MRNHGHKPGIGALVLLMVAALVPMTMASAQTGGTPALFTDAGEGRSAYTAPGHVARHRLVHVDVGALFTPDGRARSRTQLPSVELDLFPDVSYTGKVTRTSQAALDGSISWYGDLDGVEGGYFYLIVLEDAFIAHLASTEGIFEVSAAGDGLYRVVEIDQSALTEAPQDVAFDTPPPTDPAPDLPASRAADSGDVIDVLVVYTDDARAAEGGAAPMKARIALAMEETNISYAQAGVQTRLRLVHTAEVSYNENKAPAQCAGDTDIMCTALFDLQNPSDGVIDQVHTMRDTYGADMVSLITATGGFCGISYSTLGGASQAFQVTALDCMTGYYSFGHEFGHLQGARHDAYVDSGTWPYAYGHGWVNVPDRWRTIMAYNNKCADSGYDCTRLQWWSNPGVRYGGDRMGNSSAKNFKVLNETAYQVANWRKSVFGDDFDSQFTSKSKGWREVVGEWTVDSNGRFSSAGKPDRVASVYHTGQYGDLTFEARVRRNGSCTWCYNQLVIRGRPAKLTPEKEWRPSYQFAYTNDGQYSVWRTTSGGTTKAVQDWTADPAIKPGRWNKLKVVAVGSDLSFYINNQLVWSGTDSKLTIGKVGIGFYRDDSPGTMLIDWAKLTVTPTADPAEMAVDGAIGGIEVPAGTAKLSR